MKILLVGLVTLLSLSNVSCQNKRNRDEELLLNNALRLLGGTFGDAFKHLRRTNSSTKVSLKISMIPVTISKLKSPTGVWYYVNITYENKPDDAFLMGITMENGKVVAEFAIFKTQTIYQTSRRSVLQRVLNRIVTENSVIRSPRCSCKFVRVNDSLENLECILPRCFFNDNVRTDQTEKFTSMGVNCNGLYFIENEEVFYGLHKIRNSDPSWPKAFRKYLKQRRICVD
ncbi:uncharacterized protein LOC131936218 [Physella acuta]|uniref:uncharacterized protein LOC131936218 n=1 Tax=Physella acuta TaxID=109671 RepID=UPI0027DBD7AA|nr:uncharacterized protein LOC131936218 [Physella acuta]